MTLMLGNGIALIASILMVYTGILKQKKQILYTQTIQIFLSIISNLILEGMTGAIINFISCIRNIACYYERLRIKEKTILIILAIFFSLMLNNRGIIGLLPLVSLVVYTLFMDTKDVLKFKFLIIFSMIMWGIYDLYIQAYTAAIFDFMSICANAISIYNIRKNSKS